MERPHLVDKPVGATPLQALEMLRAARDIGPSTKLSYAGRLDPMASGLLAVLHGDMLRHQEEYWYLPKQYEAEIVFGVSTDSYDLLGLPVLSKTLQPARERLTPVLQGMVGKIDLSVPVFSSQRQNGRALFALARSPGDDPIVVPVRRMSVSQIDVREVGVMQLSELIDTARLRSSLVTGDFRQDDIRNAWEACSHREAELTRLRMEVHCASGTYIRSIANEIGKRLGTGAVLTSLRRTRIGAWRITDADVIALSWPR